MEKLPKIMIGIICIIIILIIMLVIVTTSNKTGNTGTSEIYYVEDFDPINELRKVSTRNNYYAVKQCIDKFYTEYINLSNDISQENAEIVYNMLDEEYIQAQGITKSNIASKLAKVVNSTVDITEMYVSEKTNNISIYLVKGTLREKRTNVMTDFEIILKMDSINKTFKLLLQDYIIAQKYENIETANINVPNRIVNNSNNTYSFMAIADEEYIQDMFLQYKNYLIYNKEKAYSKLDEQYKNKRFSSFQSFSSYVDTTIKTIRLEDYTKIINQDKTVQYVCIDNFGNKYVFKEEAVMCYTVQLDDYTLKNRFFDEAYENASNMDKGLLNCDKFFKMLNMQDYTSAYNVLDETFKQTYFKTQVDFENYIKNKLFRYNKATYKEYGNQISSIHTFKVHITDVTEQNTNTIEFNIVMRLGEGTNFVMSFEVK